MNHGSGSGFAISVCRPRVCNPSRRRGEIACRVVTDELEHDGVPLHVARDDGLDQRGKVGVQSFLAGVKKRGVCVTKLW